MRLTTLGTGTISLNARRACAGHLVEAGAVRLLMDCGSGVARGMAEREIDWWGVTHVALTHFHTDHIADLPTLLFAWRHARIPGREAPLDVIGPAGTRALLDRMADAFGQWLTIPGFPLTVREIAPDEAVELGDGVTLAARKVPHTDESVAYSVERGGRRVVYTGDTGFDASLGEWAAGADVFLAECSLPDELGIPIHLTPSECGRLAAAAAPGLLALTHLYPPLEPLDVPALVAAEWSGPVVVAHDGWAHVIEEDSCSS
jgi:ribonuclease BN (tRNA processing enzyme)